MNLGQYRYRALQVFHELRAFSPDSVYEQSTNYIRSAKTKNSNYIWLAVMLVEWALAQKSRACKKMRYRDFRRLMNRLIILQNYTKGPAQCQTPTAWLRRISYQQFCYQQKLRKVDISRQFFLFGEGGPAQKLGRVFSQISGISLRDFSFLCFGAIAHTLIEKGYCISSGWFRNVKHAVSKGAIERFLSLLVHEEPFRKPGHESDYYEPSPLFKTPLIARRDARDNITYEYLHDAHLSEALRDFIYDHLKAADANGFMGQFGESFSNYIESLFYEADLQCIPERELKKNPKFRNSKVVDFVVSEPDTLILVEAKAIATSQTTRSTASGETLGQRLRDSLLKAIVQARKTALNLREEGGGRNFHLIITTYKPFNLATGGTLQDCIAPEILKELAGDQAEESLLPFENIFIFSIDELERLLAAIAAKKTTFGAFLTAVKKRQTDPRKMKFLISQHLDVEGLFGFPASLEKHVNDIFEELVAVLRDVKVMGKSPSDS